jgi:predicted RNA binding protein YcfA (HicA-like mRNA interferase family)
MEWSSADVITVLEAVGFTLARRESHDTYTKPGHPRIVSVPRDRKSLAKGTVGAIWRQVGITAAEARELRQ